MDSDSDEKLDDAFLNNAKLAEMVLKEKKENPKCFISHWDADEDVEADTEEDRKKSKAKQFLFAAENNDIKTLENLYSENPNVISCVDSDGYTPLHRACYEGHIDAVKFLLSNGADINARTAEGWSPLHSACFWGHAHVAALLLHCKNCDVNATTKGNQTALHLAAQNSSNLKLFETLLLNPFIDPSILNSTNETPKNIAVRNFKYNEIFDLASSDINLM